MPLRIDIAAPDAEEVLPAMREGVAALAKDLPELLGCRVCANRATSAESGLQGFEVHVELLFPERQLIVNRSGTIPKAVLREALSAARALARAHEQNRHPGIAHDVLGIAA